MLTKKALSGIALFSLLWGRHKAWLPFTFHLFWLQACLEIPGQIAARQAEMHAESGRDPDDLLAVKDAAAEQADASQTAVMSIHQVRVADVGLCESVCDV